MQYHGNFLKMAWYSDTCIKVFNNWPSKICERQSLIDFTWSIAEYIVLYTVSICFTERGNL